MFRWETWHQKMVGFLLEDYDNKEALNGEAVRCEEVWHVLNRQPAEGQREGRPSSETLLGKVCQSEGNKEKVREFPPLPIFIFS